MSTPRCVLALLMGVVIAGASGCQLGPEITGAGEPCDTTDDCSAKADGMICVPTDETDQNVCMPAWAPDAWKDTCDAKYYGDGECDCGCGVVDSDCDNATASACKFSHCLSGQSPAQDDNTTCVPG